ncbi:unnamed protein product [Echinostoma caproni]|uniref:AMP-binding domain-containing protein n=1 Tax=Echinostoma caproni TaxID=27848 RepID=A0A183AYJ8_9TREM|nr:unnamed protein product [Echinostoma caproni]
MRQFEFSSIPWPCYLEDCVSPCWKPSSPCVQFWSKIGAEAIPTTLTFAEFDDYTSQLCNIFITHISRLPNYLFVPIVAILWSPHVLTTVAVHAVAKARLCFFPVDGDDPSILKEIERYVVAIIDLRKSKHITELFKHFSPYKNSETNVFTNYDWRLFLRNPFSPSSWIDNIEDRPVALSDVHLEEKSGSFTHLAYAITSSGSSGGPGKIAFISDACFTANISDLCLRFPTGHVQKSVLLTAPLTFDPSLVQMYFALTTGRCLIIPDSGLLCHPHSMAFFCRAAHVDWLQCTPSLFMLQSQTDRHQILSTPGINVLLGGEPFPLALYENSKVVNANLYNIYGVTEVSCWATLYKNLRCNYKYELVLSREASGFHVFRRTGAHLSLAAYRNCVSKLCSPAPWPTGDLVLPGSCGECLWFVGRKDRSKKRFGHQICLETLEAAICKYQHRWVDIKYCRCKLSPSRSGQLLVAFIWVNSRSNRTDYHLSNSFLRHLRYRIVFYLRDFFSPNAAPWIPAGFVFRKGLPILSAHGKICHLAGVVPIEQRGKLMMTLRLLMMDYGFSLHSKRTFFELGGSSLQAIHFMETLVQHCHEIKKSKAKLLAKLFSLSISEFARAVISCSFSGNSFKRTTAPFRRVYHLPESQACFHRDSLVFNPSRHAQIFISGTAQLHNNLNKSGYFRPLWRKPFEKCIDASAIIISAPTVKDPVVCIGSHSGLFSVADLRTGTTVWSVNIKERIECSSTFGFDSSDLLIGVGTLSGNVHGFHLDSGRLLWTIHVEGAVKGTPLFLPQKSLFVLGSHGRKVYAIDPRTPCGLSWINSFDNSPIVAPISSNDSPEFADQIFVASLGGMVGSIDLRNPERTLWSIRGMPPVFAKPIVYNEAPHNPSVVVSFVDSTIHSYSSISGKQLWRTQRLCATSNVFKDALTPVQNNLLIPTNNGMLFNVNASSGEVIWKQILSENLTAGEPTSLNTPSLLYSVNNSSKERFLVLSRADGNLFFCSYSKSCVDDSEPLSILSSFKLPGHCFSNPVLFSHGSSECFMVIGCRDDNLRCFSIAND